MIDSFLYVCDTNNHVIRRIDFTENQVITIVGNGNQCINSQMTSGKNGLDMALASPWDIVQDPLDNSLFIAMAGTHQIWKFNLGTIYILRSKIFSTSDQFCPTS